LQRKCGVPIVVNWAELQKAEQIVKEGEYRVTLDLRDAPVWAILKAIFPAISSAKQSMIRFSAVGNAIFILNAPIIDSRDFFIRTYDIRDLLADEIWVFPKELFVLHPDLPMEKRAAVLVEMIGAYVMAGDWSPDTPVAYLSGTSWDDVRIYISAGRLIVFENSEGHRKVLEFLHQLRNPEKIGS
jgi:hypothetical protein